MSIITPFKFTVVSDVHNQQQGAWSPNYRGFYSFLHHINENEGGVFGDFIIANGDDSGTKVSGYEMFPAVMRERVDEEIGIDYRMLYTVGNHDIVEPDNTPDYRGLEFIRAEWAGTNSNQSGNREAVHDYAYPGPDGCESSQFYFFHKGMMFVVMNWYWDGTSGANADMNGYDPIYSGGKIVPEQITWLTNLFTQYPSYPKLVFGHGNAFAFTSRHDDYSYLGGYSKTNRDAFWNLLENYNVIAYVHGHTHQQAFHYVDNLYFNGTIDSWDGGKSSVAHVCPGGIYRIYSGGAYQSDSFRGAMTVDVDYGSATFNFYRTTDSAGHEWSLHESKIVRLNLGKQWYYSQNKIGTSWFDKVNNQKGWTLDFNLTVSDVQNHGGSVEELHKADGAGIYVNDGTAQEIVNFMPQEIFFTNSNKSVVFDTTVEHDYRLTGKGNQLKLFAKPYNHTRYEEVTNCLFSKKATVHGNSFEPCVFEDSDGILYAVWWDDGNGVGTIFYSKYEDSVWSDPEEVLSSESGVKNPSILVDENHVVYVSYESMDGPGSVVGFVYRNSVGWSSPYYVGVNSGRCKHCKMVFDSQFNVCVVWEDGRDIHPEIYANVFDISKLLWRGEKKISSSSYGCYRPSVSSYLDHIYVCWTQKETGGTYGTYSTIRVSRFNPITNEISGSNIVSSNSHFADCSSIIVNVTGKIFIVWHDDVSGSYRIYASVLNPSFDVLTAQMVIDGGNGGSRFPVLSEHTTTGDVYVVWQDFKDGSYDKFIIPDPGSDPYYDFLSDPYYSAPDQGREPLNSTIYTAVYRNGSFLSGGNGSFDVKLVFIDNRNCFYPAVPPFFGGEIPILYQCYLADEYYYLNNQMMSQIYCALYDLSRDSASFDVNYGEEGASPISPNRDMKLTFINATKEVRFGNFSNVFSVHYVLKNIKIYADDAVEPYSLYDINASAFSLESLSSLDAAINNYGDVWIVGTCGIFYFINKQNRVISVGPAQEILGLESITSLSTEDEKDSEISALKTFKAITFDKNHNIYIGGGDREDGTDTIRYSFNPIYGFKSLGTTIPKVTALTFDRDNRLFVGTENGLRIFDVSENESDISVSEVTSEYSDIPSEWITVFQVDSNNCIWIGTRNGLYRCYKKKCILFDTSNGLSSNRINDIAVRNTSIRYIATANGINKMVGFSFDKSLQSDEALWNNNVKSLLWKDPNILFAGTMSKLNQITINDVEDVYSASVITLSQMHSVAVDDFQTYYILSEAPINDSDVMEVYINGQYIAHGYDFGKDRTTPGEPSIIRFHTPLNHDDIIEVLVRRDIRAIGSFMQSDHEIKSVGQKHIHIKDFAAETTGSSSTRLYVVTEGDENEVKVNDSDSNLPYDKIHLDTTPPHFEDGADGIKIIDQLDRNIVRVTISGATDSSATDSGSGISQMVVSNYENFTTDGFTSQTPVPYSESYNHNIGSTLDIVVRDLVFDSGSGSVISYFPDVNELYASTSVPSILYKYNWVDAEWEILYEYDEDRYIDFVVKYNNKLFVSLGHPTKTADVYVYNYSLSANIYSLALSSILSIGESRAYSAHELNGKLYIGSGIGSGDEYQEGVGTSGVVYVYNDGTAEQEDPSLTVVVSGIDDNIYDLSHAGGKSSLLAATGESGYVYEINIEGESSAIIYNSDEPLVSIASCQYGTNQYVFAGGSAYGIIRRSLSTNNSFDTSFRTTSCAINTLKVFSVAHGSSENLSPVIFASAGAILYYLSSAGTWIWKYTHTEVINDFTYNPSSQVYYVISNSGITKLNPSTQEKTVYLKLIDRAGNESVLAPPYSTSPFVDSITLSDLVDFVNENKLFEIDSNGNVVFTLSESSGKYYSGDKIEEEKGEYISEVFDGTNDLVKWQNISWDATEYGNTYVYVYVRTSSSSNDILSTNWIGPYPISQCSGVDLSSFSGQYVQFKAELISRAKGFSPSFHSATIRAITTESIHFFTTNFVMPNRILKGIVTSQKIVPVAADIVFGINTTNSVNWTEYQEVDENRIFNINQVGENFRVGIKFISPNRSLVTPSTFDEYGPYNSSLYVNTVDFNFTNNSGVTNHYHFRVTVYNDVGLNNKVYEAYSSDNPDGFSVDGIAIPSAGTSISQGQTVTVLFTVPGSANVECGHYYYVKTEVYDITLSEFSTITDDHSFIASCTSNFIDNIEFNFVNNEVSAGNYHFRIKFYEDPERINEYKTIFSGNDETGWFVDDVQMPSSGAAVNPGETVRILYRADPSDFESDKIYYLTIKAHNGLDYVFEVSSYTFQVKDVVSTEYCGGYSDVPIVKNFGIMIELNENEFVTLNI
jgi:hypothetical protein